MNGWSTFAASSTGAATSTLRSASTATRVDSATIVSRSCVTITTVSPSVRCSVAISSTNSSDACGSRPAVGSSRNSSSGSSAIARAMPTRLTIPPDSAAGIFDACLHGSPTISSFSITMSCSRSGGTRPSSRSGCATLSNTVIDENSAPCWNSIPERVRIIRALASSIVAVSSPNTLIVPDVGRSRPRIWRTSVVLPEPEPPTIDTISPRRTSKSSFW